MSSLDSKLEYRPPSVQSPARRRLSTLEKARGYVVLKTRDGVAELVRIDLIEGTSAWRRVEPGKDGMFELEYVRGGDDA